MHNGTIDSAKAGSLKLILTISEKAILEPFSLAIAVFAMLGREDIFLKDPVFPVSNNDSFFVSSFERGKP